MPYAVLRKGTTFYKYICIYIATCYPKNLFYGLAIALSENIGCNEYIINYITMYFSNQHQSTFGIFIYQKKNR